MCNNLMKLDQSRWLDIDQVLFSCIFMDRDKVKVHKKKNRKGQISSHLD